MDQFILDPRKYYDDIFIDQFIKIDYYSKVISL